MARTFGFITPLGEPVYGRRTVLREAPDESTERRDGSKSPWSTVTGAARAVGSWTAGLVTQRAPKTPEKAPQPARLELPRWLNQSAADGPTQPPPPSSPAKLPQQTAASSLVSAAAAAVSDAFEGSGGSSDSDAPSTAGISAVSRQRSAGTTRDSGSEGGGNSGGGNGGGAGGVGAWFSGLVRRVQNGTANAAATTAIVLSGGGTPAPLPPAERAKRLLDAAIPARQSQMDASFLNV